MKELIPLYPLLKSRIALAELSNGEPVLLIENATINFSNFSITTLTTGKGIHAANELLHSLNTGIEIKFENFKQYSELLKSIAKKLKVPYSYPNGKNKS